MMAGVATAAAARGRVGNWQTEELANSVRELLGRYVSRVQRWGGADGGRTGSVEAWLWSSCFEVVVDVRCGGRAGDGGGRVNLRSSIHPGTPDIFLSCTSRHAQAVSHPHGLRHRQLAILFSPCPAGMPTALSARRVSPCLLCEFAARTRLHPQRLLPRTQVAHKSQGKQYVPHAQGRREDLRIARWDLRGKVPISRHHHVANAERCCRVNSTLSADLVRTASPMCRHVCANSWKH